MKWLRYISAASAIMPSSGWLVTFNGNPDTIPPYCTWCGEEWGYLGEDDHMVCPKCDLLEGEFE